MPERLAEYVFGGVGESSLLGLRSQGAYRGLLRLHVPFVDLAAYRDQEARFLAAVEIDPVLTRVPLVYVIAPNVA